MPHTCFFEHLAEKGLHFVGSLPPSDHPGLRAVDATVDALGANRRAVLTRSPNLHAKQSAGFDQTWPKPPAN
ncbi:hypothetical protein [Arthrobacter sp. UYCu723]